jgi:hypothetical protein
MAHSRAVLSNIYECGLRDSMRWNGGSLLVGVVVYFNLEVKIEMRDVARGDSVNTRPSLPSLFIRPSSLSPPKHTRQPHRLWQASTNLVGQHRVGIGGPTRNGATERGEGERDRCDRDGRVLYSSRAIRRGNSWEGGTHVDIHILGLADRGYSIRVHVASDCDHRLGPLGLHRHHHISISSHPLLQKSVDGK